MLQWCERYGIQVNIYSSGSIGAQKLLFGNSMEGDLLSHFHQHFDTTSGNKKQSSSYQTIAEQLTVGRYNSDRYGGMSFVS
jgi:methionine salvage enolase-phosphatase E1